MRCMRMIDVYTQLIEKRPAGPIRAKYQKTRIITQINALGVYLGPVCIVGRM